MNTYLVLLRGGNDEYNALAEAERKELVANWGDYIGRLAEGGHWIKGNPLGEDGRVLNRNAAPVEGVSAQGEAAVGFMLLEAESYDHAVQLANNCPSLRNGSELEIREAVEM